MNVIQSSSGHQGWVRANRLTVYLTHHKQSDAVLGSTVTGKDDLPVLAVTNSTDKMLYLHLNQLAEIYVRPHETKNITVPTGIYSFNAAVANVAPLFGYKEFPNGMEYTWEFVIRSGGARTQTQSVSAASRAHIQQLQDAVNALKTDVNSKALQIDVDKTAMTQQEAQLQADTDAIDAKRQGLDQTSQDAIDGFNKLVDDRNVELAACKQAETAFNAEVDAYNAELANLKQKQDELYSIADSINKGR